MHTAHGANWVSSTNRSFTSVAFGLTNSAETVRPEEAKAASVNKRMLECGLTAVLDICRRAAVASADEIPRAQNTNAFQGLDTRLYYRKNRATLGMILQRSTRRQAASHCQSFFKCPDSFLRAGRCEVCAAPVSTTLGGEDLLALTSLIVDLVNGALGPGPWSLGSVRRRSTGGTKLVRPARARDEVIAPKE
jgi:hypothetical protein